MAMGNEGLEARVADIVAQWSVPTTPWRLRPMGRPVHPADLLRVQYAQSVELPPSPENANAKEPTLRRLREEATIEDKLAAWQQIQLAAVVTAPVKRRVR